MVHMVALMTLYTAWEKLHVSGVQIAHTHTHTHTPQIQTHKHTHIHTHAGGFKQVEAKYPALLFKQQLDAFVQKIFPMIRDNVKKQISPMVSNCIHTPKGLSARPRTGAAAEQGGKSKYVYQFRISFIPFIHLYQLADHHTLTLKQI